MGHMMPALTPNSEVEPPPCSSSSSSSSSGSSSSSSSVIRIQEDPTTVAMSLMLTITGRGKDRGGLSRC